MASNWVDFAAVKAAVSIQQALDHYQINWLRKKDSELRGRCPIHKGDGEDAFHVSLLKNAFHCFSCKARGNVLDFVAAMEKCSVRDAALKLAGWFSVGTSESERSDVQTSNHLPASSRGEHQAINPPLAFQLKGINPDHPYLRDRGISRELAQGFGVGYFSGNGSMSGRVVIPIHNERGELVAYAGRAVDGSEPKYKLPAGFHKSAELFNLHRAVGESGSERQVVVVEGFFDAMKVHQAGFPALALMGCSMSEQQEALLVRHFKSVWLMFDGDDAGRQATDELLLRLGKRMWTRAVTLPDGKQPDMLTPEELTGLMGK